MNLIQRVYHTYRAPTVFTHMSIDIWNFLSPQNVKGKIEGTQGKGTVVELCTTKFDEITNLMPVIGDVFKPVTITFKMKKSLLWNLLLSKGRRTATMALECCARTVALG